MSLLYEIKPLCDKIVKDGKKDDVIQLKEKLKHFDRNQLQQMQDYILLPLISQIDGNQSM